MEFKNQHYVPQAYLSNFATEAGQIWVYNKQTRKSFQTQMRNVAAERHFYGADLADELTGDRNFIEKCLSQLDGGYASFSKNLLPSFEPNKGIVLDEECRGFLAVFMAFQMYRTREMRQFQNQFQAKMQEFVRTSYADAKIEIPAEYAQSAGEGHEAYSKELQASQLLDGPNLEHTAQILLDHIWVVTKAHRSGQYLTSDHPFAKRAHLDHPFLSMSGIASPGIEIFFPLSPQLALHLYERGHFHKIATLDGTVQPSPLAANLIYTNQFQIYHSNRFVFSQNGDFAFVERVLDENPEFANPNRKRVSSDRESKNR